VGTGADAKLILEMKIGTIVCFREFTRIPGAATLNAAAGSKAVALVNAPAAAKDLPDFRGRWQLSASRNFDAYLVALGVNYVKRQLAAAMKPVQDWTQLADGTWQFVVQSPLGAKTEAFPLGHEVVDVVDGDEMLKKSIWQGTLLYTSVVPKDPKKAEALGTMFMCDAARRGAARLGAANAAASARIRSRAPSAHARAHAAVPVCPATRPTPTGSATSRARASAPSSSSR
jgi:hypothetical protein